MVIFALIVYVPLATYVCHETAVTPPHIVPTHGHPPDIPSHHEIVVTIPQNHLIVATTGRGAEPLVGVTEMEHLGVTSVHELLQLLPGSPLLTPSSHSSVHSTILFQHTGHFTIGAVVVILLNVHSALAFISSHLNPVSTKYVTLSVIEKAPTVVYI